MNHASTSGFPDPRDCTAAYEEAVHQYMDGELAIEAQSSLFAHLAGCDGCRRLLASTLEFRRMSRQEALAVPSALDDAFFHRLDQLKRRSQRVDRSSERRPLWRSRAPVSLRTAATVAFLLFVAGLLFPQSTGGSGSRASVVGQEDKIEFIRTIQVQGESVYVFYPGLTVEATKVEQPSRAEAL